VVINEEIEAQCNAILEGDKPPVLPVARVHDRNRVYFVDAKDRLYYDIGMRRLVKCGLSHVMRADLHKKIISCAHRKCDIDIKVTVEAIA
jgi:hypothetical protein